MNQYNFQPHTEHEIKQMQRIAFGFVLFFALLFVLAFAGCSEKEAMPTVEERLGGFWIGGAWNHETSRYHFHEGAMWAEMWLNGALVDRQDYHYTTKGDRVNILDIATFERREYRVEFPTDTTAWLEALPLGVDINLVRID